MSTAARESYLQSSVQTATPQKLHLMLIEGAIRFCRQTQHHWEADRRDDAAESLIRAQEIMTELISVLQPDDNPELVKRVAGVYLYIFRQMMMALHESDAEKLAEVITLLEFERETWALVCEKLAGEAPAAEETSDFNDAPTPDNPPAAPPLNLSNDDDEPYQPLNLQM